MSETNPSIRSLNGHTLIDQEARDMAAQNATGISKLSEDSIGLSEEVGKLSEENVLHADVIKGTVQTVTFNADGMPAKVVHAVDGVTIRTDTFAYAGDVITETRATAAGTLRIVTNAKTLSVEVE